jgi:hypothetical protein
MRRFESSRPSQSFQVYSDHVGHALFRRHRSHFGGVLSFNGLAKPLARYGASAGAPGRRLRPARGTQYAWFEGVVEGFEPAGLVLKVPGIIVHESDAPDFPLTCMMPTFWPANTMLRLTIRRDCIMRAIELTPLAMRMSSPTAARATPLSPPRCGAPRTRSEGSFASLTTRRRPCGLTSRPAAAPSHAVGYVGRPLGRGGLNGIEPAHGFQP